MPTVQMNVRIDAQLKNAVDKVLRRDGLSASDAIRSLWLYIADRQQVPHLETLAEEQARDEERRRRLALVEDSAGYVQRELAQANLTGTLADIPAAMSEDATPERTRDAMYDWMLDDYLGMERSE